ncbi:hypothetical protein H4R20_003423, partial [Coemansia guatemalensis]
MDHRREELEKKRAKLAELRRQREERKRAAMQTREQQQHQQPGASGGKADSQDINELVNSLVGDRARSPSRQHSPATGAGTPRMSHEVPGIGRDRSISSATSIGTQMGSPVARAATPSAAGFGDVSAAAGSGMAAGLPRAVPQFKASSTVIFDFPPKETIVYNKEVQTADGGVQPDEGLLTEEEIERR